MHLEYGALGSRQWRSYPRDKKDMMMMMMMMIERKEEEIG